MLIINITRKNARVLLPLMTVMVYSQAQPTPVVHWDKHALRLTNSVK